ARATRGSELLAVAGVAASPLLLGAVLRGHFDLVAVALTAWALVALVEDRPRLGMTLLGAGALTKVFPIAAAPVALAWLAGRARRHVRGPGHRRGRAARRARLRATGAARAAARVAGGDRGIRGVRQGAVAAVRNLDRAAARSGPRVAGLGARRRGGLLDGADP